MKNGDVFIVDGRGPLFIADTVTPSGSIYARKFDVYKGAYSGTEAFPTNTEFMFLFSSLGLSGNFTEIKIGSATLEDFVSERKQSFKECAERSKPKDTLEGRMRPGAYSVAGFLGVTESLEFVLAQDEQALIKQRLTFEEIADELEKIVKSAVEQEHDFRSAESRKRSQYFPNFDQSIVTPENLPSLDVGYLIDNYQVFFAGTKGTQDCPWNCHLSNDWSSFIFLLLNRQTGEYITAPGLIVHLIREHHFFEGMESPYRVDPLKLAQVLGHIS